MIEPERPSIEGIRYVNAKRGSCVEYDRETGTTCPVCGIHHLPSKCGIHTTYGWINGLRERYHRCPLCNSGFRSQETK